MAEEKSNENQIIPASSAPQFWKILRGKSEVTQPLIQSARIYLERANTSTDPSEANKWLELYNKTQGLYLNESEDNQLFEKIKYTSNPTEASQSNLCNTIEVEGLLIVILFIWLRPGKKRVICPSFQKFVIDL